MEDFDQVWKMEDQLDIMFTKSLGRLRFEDLEKRIGIGNMMNKRLNERGKCEP